MVAEECVNSSLAMGRGEGLEEDRLLEGGSTENEKYIRKNK